MKGLFKLLIIIIMLTDVAAIRGFSVHEFQLMEFVSFPCGWNRLAFNQ